MDLSVIPSGAIAAFIQILLIDVVLAGDNAIVVGALAAGLPADQRKKVIMIGVAAALVLRIAFALVVSQLLQIVGLVLAGGILLLWVAWRMFHEIRHKGESAGSDEVSGDEHSGVAPAKSFASAAWGVALADVSMSLDNVLAGAGVRSDPVGAADGRSREHHRALHRPLSLDRVDRLARDPVGRSENDLRR